MVDTPVDVYVGIDSGVNTGFAVWHVKGKSINPYTYRIHKAMEMVVTICSDPNIRVHVRFEDARLRKWFGKANASQLQGAGSIKRDSTIWHDFLTDLSKSHPNITFEAVAPKDNKTKLSVEQFEVYTGYKGKTSEHARDAAMLVYGYGLNQVKQLTL